MPPYLTSITGSMDRCGPVTGLVLCAVPGNKWFKKKKKHSFSMPQHHFDTPYTPNMVPSHNNIPHPAYQNMRPVTPMKSRFDRYYPRGQSMHICKYPQQSSHANFWNRPLQNQQQSYHGGCAQDIHPTITAPACRKSLVSNIYIVNKHEMLTNSLDLLAGEAEIVAVVSPRYELEKYKS